MEGSMDIQLVDKNLFLHINGERWRAFNNSLKCGELKSILPSDINLGWIKINRKPRCTTLTYKLQDFTHDSFPIRFNPITKINCSMLEYEIRILINNLERKMNFDLPDNLLRIKNFEPNLPTDLWIKLFKGSLKTACMLNKWFFKNIFPTLYSSFCNYMISQNKIAEIPSIKMNINDDILIIKKINHIETLPDELLELITYNCDINSLIAINIVNRKFNNVIKIMTQKNNISLFTMTQIRKEIYPNYYRYNHNVYGGMRSYFGNYDYDIDDSSSSHDIDNDNDKYDYYDKYMSTFSTNDEYDEYDEYDDEYYEYMSTLPTNDNNDNTITIDNIDSNDSNDNNNLFESNDISQHFANWAYEVKIAKNKNNK